MIRKLLLTLCTLALTLAASAYAVEPIRIGTTQSLTGPLAEYGTNQLRGLQMWVGDVNARGRLLGRTVELVYYDDGSDPGRSAQLYQKLIEQDKVDLLASQDGTPPDLAELQWDGTLEILPLDTAPAELAGHFAAASLALSAVFWVALGWACGSIWERLATRAA